MLCKVFKLKSRLRFAVTILIALLFPISSAGALAHCVEMPDTMKSSASDNGQPGHALQMNDDDDAHHATKGHSHNHEKKSGKSSVSVCTGSGAALIAQCSFGVSTRLVAADFAATVEWVVGLSVPPASEPPRI